MSFSIRSVADIKTFFREEFTEPIFFISPDPLWGIGLEKIIPHYHIVCLDASPIIPLLRKAGVNVFCLEEALAERNTLFRSSRHLLSHPKVLEYLRKNAQDRKVNLIFFKQPFEAKSILRKLGGNFKVRILNNSAATNKKFEDKVSFYKTCKGLPISFPKSYILCLKKADYDEFAARLGKKFVVQFGRGWAGNTSFFIEKREDLRGLQKRFPYPDLLVKVSQFIEGETLINNACITKQGTLVSAPFLQITGIEGLTASAAGTCGNEWAKAEIEESNRREILKETLKLGELMRKSGFKGYFGLDILVKKAGKRIFVSENNARITASVPMYTKLELRSSLVPFLVYHLLEFLEANYRIDYETRQGYAQKKFNGAQLVVRNTQNSPVRVKRSVPAGVYRWDAKTGLNFIQEGYSIDDLINASDLLVLPVAEDRLVNPGIELFRIQTLGTLMNHDLHLYPQILAMVEKIKFKLGLEK